ncbi:MAG: DUF2336 domain-containing protein [Hyphomicrobiales bacterium]|nr:DUF2336 domain-containing protein [Hyphomicrobiales bacterium]MCP4998434.1 DUF2336 domain-containing protein [Hyphomicrobiales bacterium]
MDRFRDLERAGETGRKDAALLAAIAGFEALKHPTSHDLRQFSNLFIGLFALTREDTRRTAAAALSRIRHLPQEVSMIVADQPIRIAAPFLAFSPCISDPVLLRTISKHGGAHARAISRRNTLSAVLKEALSELNDTAVARSLRLRHLNGATLRAPEAEARKIRDENVLRNRIKEMALARMNKPMGPNARSPEIGRPDLGRLVHYAQASQMVRFSHLLARALGSDRSLADRIMLDVSGTQLAMALQALNMCDAEILQVLIGIYPPLGQLSSGAQHATLVLQSTSRKESVDRVAAWVRANAPKTSQASAVYEPHTNNNSERTGRTKQVRPSDQTSSPATIKRAIKRA